MIFKTFVLLGVLPLSTVHGFYDRAAALSDQLNGRSEGYKFPVNQVPMGGRVRPHFPQHHHEGGASGTIYETLASNPKFSKVTKALDFVEDIAELLNSTDSKFTFFAPPDEALRRPKRDDDHHFQWASLTAWNGDGDGPHWFTESQDLASAVDLLEDIDNPYLPSDPKKRKQILKFIIRILLSYHIIREDGYDIVQLTQNTTYPTNLVFPFLLDKQPLRLRVEHHLVPPATTVNFFSAIVHPNINATNGFIHAINHPLIPPPTLFAELYFIPEVFSFFTSTLQRSNLTLGLDLTYSKETHLAGARAVTVFAPTNRAFQRLPRKLKYFLFSPFGAHVLTKLLEYHIVPEVVLHSDYVHTTKAHKQIDYEFQALDVHKCHAGKDISLKNRILNRLGLGRKGGPVKVEPIFKKNVTLDTAFFNHTLNVFVLQNKITLPFPGGHHHNSFIDTKVFVNRQLVHVRDIVGSNGAIHVIDKLLDPRGPHPPPGSPPHRRRRHHHHHHHHHEHDREADEVEEDYDDTWEDWEDWLPQWAAGN